LLLFLITSNAQSIEKISFNSVSSSNNTFQPIAGTPYGQHLSNSNGSLTVSSEYGKTTFEDDVVTTSNTHTKPDKFKVYPNPTIERVSIELSNSNQIVNIIALYNQLGQLLELRNVVNSNEQIDFSKYENGTYFITLGSEGKVVERFKIVKTK
jgi:hypothetical protein